MTKQSEVLEDSKYKTVLDHGFVGLVDVMGNDQSIVNAARVSYGAGTRKVNEDRGLIRYLLRHDHTTPFEMVEFKFHCKMPIFVARQWIRHRTANVNEYSGRYSVMTEDYYVPEAEHISPQSKTNNQGREINGFNIDTKRSVQSAVNNVSTFAYDAYLAMLGEEIQHGNKTFVEDSDFEEMAEKGGLARELARMVLPVNYYTEWYWKIDLHNLMHFLRLRMDSHAQYEIQVFANAMYELIKPHIPLAAEAFEDYKLNGTKLSGSELEIIRDFFKAWDVNPEGLEQKAYEQMGNKREAKEFVNKLFKNR